MKRALCVGDDESVSKQVAEALRTEGYEVICVVSDPGVTNAISNTKPDIILLGDCVGGWNDQLRSLRQENNLPLIVLSERTDEIYRVLALELGADDYIVNPFSSRELVARVRAMLRRSAIIREAAERQKTLEFAGLVIDLPTRSVKVDDDEVHLTPKEFDLLYHLASQPRHVFSRQQILEQVWAPDRGGHADYRTVDTHIKRLRQKLETRGDHPWSMATVWGVGYKFDVAP